MLYKDTYFSGLMKEKIKKFEEKRTKTEFIV